MILKLYQLYREDRETLDWLERIYSEEELEQNVYIGCGYFRLSDEDEDILRLRYRLDECEEKMSGEPVYYIMSEPWR